jgi:hypothetical protein
LFSRRSCERTPTTAMQFSRYARASVARPPRDVTRPAPDEAGRRLGRGCAGAGLSKLNSMVRRRPGGPPTGTTRLDARPSCRVSTYLPGVPPSAIAGGDPSELGTRGRPG